MISRSLFSPFSLCQLYLFRRNSKDSYKSNFIIRVYLAVRTSTLPKAEIQLKANSNGEYNSKQTVMENFRLSVME